MKKLTLFLLIIVTIFKFNQVFAENWSSKKSSHFVVYYKQAPDDFIDNVLDSCEEYYDEITDELGFTRYEHWSWEDRAKIYIYNDSQEYVQETQQPSWSSGSTSYREKVIKTFPLASGFFDTLLPHELGHIIFREFIGFRADLPAWLDEGVACYLEKAKRWGANKIVKEAIEKKQFINLEELSQSKLSSVHSNTTIDLFYAEAGSVVYFLITKHGKYRFVSFCKALKAGNTLDEALDSSYPIISNISELNKAWLKYLENE